MRHAEDDEPTLEARRQLDEMKMLALQESAKDAGVDEAGIRNALGAAATQGAGLTGSFGTMAKPFHAGKAAMNGVLAAELAKEGFDAAETLIEPQGGFGQAFIQDGTISPQLLDFDGSMEITRNTLKPYASCL